MKGKILNFSTNGGLAIIIWTILLAMVATKSIAFSQSLSTLLGDEIDLSFGNKYLAFGTSGDITVDTSNGDVWVAFNSISNGTVFATRLTPQGDIAEPAFPVPLAKGIVGSTGGNLAIRAVGGFVHIVFLQTITDLRHVSRLAGKWTQPIPLLYYPSINSPIQGGLLNMSMEADDNGTIFTIMEDWIWDPDGNLGYDREDYHFISYSVKAKVLNKKMVSQSSERCNLAVNGRGKGLLTYIPADSYLNYRTFSGMNLGSVQRFSAPDVKWNTKMGLALEENGTIHLSLILKDQKGIKYLNNRGGSWQSQITPSIVADHSQMAIDNLTKAICIVYSKGTDLFAILSTDLGKTFQPPVRVNEEAGSYFPISRTTPKIAARDGRFYFLWTDKLMKRQKIRIATMPGAVDLENNNFNFRGKSDNGLVLLLNPNPFYIQTTIRFFMAQKGQVSLRIFEPNGRLVETLLDSKSVRGKAKIIWGSKNLHNGFYLVDLRSGRNHITRKLFLLK